MGAALPAVALGVAWVLALAGVTAPGAHGSAPFSEDALRWVLFIGLGCVSLFGGVMHTCFARFTAKLIGWETNGFQYEVGFANLGIGLAAIYAAVQDSTGGWITATIVGGVFLLLAAVNHVLEIVRERNYAPGNTLILVSDIGTPLSLLGLLICIGAL